MANPNQWRLIGGTDSQGKPAKYVTDGNAVIGPGGSSGGFSKPTSPSNTVFPVLEPRPTIQDQSVQANPNSNLNPSARTISANPQNQPVSELDNALAQPFDGKRLGRNSAPTFGRPYRDERYATGPRISPNTGSPSQVGTPTADDGSRYLPDASYTAAQRSDLYRRMRHMDGDKNTGYMDIALEDQLRMQQKHQNQLEDRRQADAERNAIVSDYRSNLVRINGLRASIAQYMQNKDPLTLNDLDKANVAAMNKEIEDLQNHNEDLKAVSGYFNVPSYRFAGGLQAGNYGLGGQGGMSGSSAGAPQSNTGFSTPRPALDSAILKKIGNSTNNLSPVAIQAMFPEITNQDELNYLFKNVPLHIKYNQENQNFANQTNMNRINLQNAISAQRAQQLELAGKQATQAQTYQKLKNYENKTKFTPAERAELAAYIKGAKSNPIQASATGIMTWGLDQLTGASDAELRGQIQQTLSDLGAQGFGQSNLPPAPAGSGIN